MREETMPHTHSVGSDAYILAEIAQKLGISKERVRQIEKSALKKIKHPAVSRRLREYLHA